jgi:uncharacterized membrane-anchored protein
VLLQQVPEKVPDIVAPTVRIVEVISPPAPSLSTIDVAITAFGLTSIIMGAAAVTGILAGVLFIWYRSRRPITIIEARGGQHDLFKV